MMCSDISEIIWHNWDQHGCHRAKKNTSKSKLLPFFTHGTDHSPARWPMQSALIALQCSPNKLEMSLMVFLPVDLGWNPQMMDFRAWPNNWNSLRTCQSRTSASSVHTRRFPWETLTNNRSKMSRFAALMHAQTAPGDGGNCCFHPMTPGKILSRVKLLKFSARSHCEFLIKLHVRCFRADVFCHWLGTVRPVLVLATTRFRAWALLIVVSCRYHWYFCVHF